MDDFIPQFEVKKFMAAVAGQDFEEAERWLELCFRLIDRRRTTVPPEREPD